jgi:hypothetical protein
MTNNKELFDKLPPHGLAFGPARSGAYDMRSGDILLHAPDGRLCRADEFLHDGDAFVTFDDGTHGTVRWNSLQPIQNKEDKSLTN